MLVSPLAVLGIDRLRRRAAADMVTVVVVGIVVDDAVVLATLPEPEIAPR